MRVSAFVDGFNLYHAIDDLGAHHLKWVNLRKLCEIFAPPPVYDLEEVLYFSAFATWRPQSYRRHREYVKALEASGVTAVMGRFKEKDRSCVNCGNTWIDHEEKETDVNIGIHLLDRASRDLYDRALLISGDSDLVPAVRMVRDRFPKKEFRIIGPVGRGFSMDLVSVAGGKECGKRMKEVHLEECLLPSGIRSDAGQLVATRPAKYHPPTP